MSQSLMPNKPEGERVLKMEHPSDRFKTTEVYKDGERYTIRKSVRRGIYHDIKGNIVTVHRTVCDDVINGLQSTVNTLLPGGVEDSIDFMAVQFRLAQEDKDALVKDDLYIDPNWTKIN